MLVHPPDSFNTKNTRCTWCVPLTESTALTKITNYKLHWLGFWKASKQQFLPFHPHSEPGWMLHSWGCAALSSLEQVSSSLPAASQWVTRSGHSLHTLPCKNKAAALKISKARAQIISRNMTLTEECGLHSWKWGWSILKCSLCK